MKSRSGLSSTTTTTTEHPNALETVKAYEREIDQLRAQQDATARILRLISTSPGDAQPIFDAIVESASRLCDAEFSAVARLEEGLFYLVSLSNLSPEEARAFHSLYPRPPNRRFVMGRAVIEAKAVQIEDVVDDAEYDARTLEVLQSIAGYRTFLGVPVLRHGEPIGVIGCGRRGVKPFTRAQIQLVETFADQAVIAIENVRLFQELESRNREISEALEQQTATTEVLRVISSSPTDIQPVFDMIARSARRLCDGEFSAVFRFDGELIHLVTHDGPFEPASVDAFQQSYPTPPNRGHAIGRAILAGTIAQIPDVEADPEYRASGITGPVAARSIAAVPMLREGRTIGGINVLRRKVGEFPENQIGLLKTFADQAVIAVENVRLFQELETRNNEITEALEQQTATAEILRVISTSPTDIQPVLDAVVKNAARFCGANDAEIFQLDGDSFRRAASHGPIPGPEGRRIPVVRGSVAGRALIDRRPVHVSDLQAESEEFPVGSDLAHEFDYRAAVAVPLLREGTAVGTINLRRAQSDPFTDKQIGLLQTFAAQAVIAIENVRLFQELETRNKEITEALEQQTATSEILRVISSSPTDVQPVFDAIVASAIHLCDAEFSAVARAHEGLLHLAALKNLSTTESQTFRSLFPRPPERNYVMGRAFMEGRPVQVEDVLSDPGYDSRTLQVLRKVAGYRTFLGVPIVRNGVSIGVIGCGRREVKPFTTTQIELVKTFADQALIAIENVRLFQELDTRNKEISEALEQQTATTEVLKVISRSTFDLKPVLETLVEYATRLCHAEWGIIYRFDGEVLRVAGYFGATPEFMEYWTGIELRPDRGSTAGRAALERRTVHMPDVLADPDYRAFEGQARGRWRSIVAVPMLKEGSMLGVMALLRNEPVAFNEKQIELVTTFADQAAIAIENVRLFQELEARNAEISDALKQQTATTEVLKVISRSAFDLQSVLSTLIENAVQLCQSDWGVIHRFEGESLRAVGFFGASPEFIDYWSRIELRLERGSALGRAALEQRTIHVLDVLEDPEYTLKDAQARGGWRSVIAVPMLREGALIGAMALMRNEVRPFTDKQMELVTTFADQAAIAIENVRLYEELQARNRDLIETLEQQTATSEILEVISSSPTDVQPVLNAVAESAVRVCSARDVLIYRVEGDLLRHAAHHGPLPELNVTTRLDRGSVAGRAVVDRRTVHIHDLAAESDDEFPLGKAFQRRFGHRTVLATPLLREGTAIGVISLRRMEVQPFTDKQVALLRTFADQAVIAIENARLFQELEARTQQLTRSVEQLKALGEIGQTITSTLDVEKVLETIVTRAVELSKSDAGTIYEFDEIEQVFEPRANYGMSEELVKALHVSRLRLGDAHSGVGRAALARSAIQIPDLEKERGHALPFLHRAGFRALLAVPLLREERIIGGLVVRRKDAGEFSEETVDLLETFATQSALAIQNARLFQQIQEKSRELEVASQHKSQFVANMSHELRTPLNAIIGYSEMLEEEAEELGEEGFLPDLKNIQIAGKHLLGLINEILDLSKIEAGRMELFLERFDVTELVDDVVATVQPLVEKNANVLQVHRADDLGRMKADLTKVRQALFNLLSNACKFTDHGTVTLEVAHELVNGGPWISFRVQDTGIGMKPEQMGRLFQAFSQADASTTRQYGGTGLGLVISRRFCQMMGGDITAASEFGKGSTFLIRLPIEVVERTDSAEPGDDRLPVQVPTIPEGAPSVLVIDDDPAVRRLMQRFLGKQGLRMLAAVDGEEGLRMAKAERPDAITLDVLMPGMDGWAVLTALKADPELAEIPVIMVSIADETHGGYALGVTDYLTKPIDWKRLKSILRKLGPADESCRVLIVEDDSRTRDMLRKRLEKQGWPVVEAENGRIGLERLGECTPDVMLLDLMMPEMDGFQLLDLMRTDERWRSIPVIIITAKELTAEDRRSLNGYVEKILQKGTYSSETLLHEVCEAVRTRVDQQAPSVRETN